MALSSSSTVADARAQLRDNLDWDDSGSVSKAKLFRAAVRFLRDAEPNGSAEGVSWSSQSYDADLERATAFIDANDSSASSSGPSATRMRAGARFRG